MQHNTLKIFKIYEFAFIREDSIATHTIIRHDESTKPDENWK